MGDFPAFFLDRGVGGWMGCIVYKLFLDFYIFFIFTRPLSLDGISRKSLHHGMVVGRGHNHDMKHDLKH